MTSSNDKVLLVYETNTYNEMRLSYISHVPYNVVDVVAQHCPEFKENLERSTSYASGFVGYRNSEVIVKIINALTAKRCDFKLVDSDTYHRDY